MKPPQNAARLAALGLLTALVLLAHWVALRGWPPTLGLERPAQTRSLVLRSVATTVGVRAVQVQAAATAPVAARPLRLAPHNAPLAAATQPVGPPPTAALPASVQESLTRPVAIAVAESARLLYDVTAESRGFRYSAHAELSWRQDGQNYDARLEISPLWQGSRIQTSTGHITSDGLAPTRFSDKSRAEQAAHFEREQGTIVFSANTPDAPLLAGAQDRLSVLFQLGAMLAGDPARFTSSTAIAVQTAGIREAETWLFILGETENLDLPGGQLVGLKLTHAPRREYEPRLELWLAPTLGYLPVRWRLTQSNGDWVEQQWRASVAP